MNKSGRAVMGKNESMAKLYNDFLWFQGIKDNAGNSLSKPVTPLFVHSPQPVVPPPIVSPVAQECPPVPVVPPCIVSPVAQECPLAPTVQEDKASVLSPAWASEAKSDQVSFQEADLFMPKVPNRRALWEGMVGAGSGVGSASFRLRESEVHSGRFSAWQKGQVPTAPQVESGESVRQEPLSPLEEPIFSALAVPAEPVTRVPSLESSSPQVTQSTLLSQFAQEKQGIRPKTVFADPVVVDRFVVKPKPELLVPSAPVMTQGSQSEDGPFSLEAWIGLSVAALSKGSAVDEAAGKQADVQALRPERKTFPFRPWGETELLESSQDRLVQDEDDDEELLVEDSSSRSEVVMTLPIEEEKWQEDDLDDAALEAELVGPFFFQTMVLPNEPSESWENFPTHSIPFGQEMEEGFAFDFVAPPLDQSVVWEALSSDQPPQESESREGISAITEEPLVDPIISQSQNKPVAGVVFTALNIGQPVLPDNRLQETPAIAIEVAAPVDETVALVEKIVPIVEEVAPTIEKIAPMVEKPASVDGIESKRQKMLAEILQLSDTSVPVKMPATVASQPKLAALEEDSMEYKARLEELLAASKLENERVADAVLDQSLSASTLSKVSSVPPLTDGEFWEEIPVEGLSRGIFHIIGDGIGLITQSVKSFAFGCSGRN